MEENLKELEEYLKSLDENTLLALGLLTGVLQVCEWHTKKGKKLVIRLTPPHLMPHSIMGDEIPDSVMMNRVVLSAIAQATEDYQLAQEYLKEYWRMKKKEENKQKIDKDKLVKRLAKVLYRQSLLHEGER